MDIQKIYNNIVNRAKLRGLIKTSLDYYTEKHHIIPKCIGGNDNSDNLVLLTFKEHCLCHIILSKLYSDVKELSLAATLMLSLRNKYENRIVISSSKLAEEIRKNSIEYLRKIKEKICQVEIILLLNQFLVLMELFTLRAKQLNRGVDTIRNWCKKITINS